MARPRLLDLFCGAGGAAVGYYRAGFDVVGIDIAPQPRFPFPFIQGDALKPPVRLEDFDAIHASPPCQRWLSFTKAPWMSEESRMRERPDCLTPIEEILMASGVPFVIENVPTSPLVPSITLCGSSFGLRVRRHRKFASNVFLFSLDCRHDLQGPPIGVYGHGGPKNPGGRGRRYKNKAEASHAMGQMDWASLGEIVEAIPPAYTTFIGKQLIAFLQLDDSERERKSGISACLDRENREPGKRDLADSGSSECLNRAVSSANDESSRQ